MKKTSFIFLFFSFVILSCQENKTDHNVFITDRIWRTLDYNQSQYYFSSTDNSKYIWLPSKREGIEFSMAQGNPDTHPYNPSPKGWLKSATFEITNDTLYWQSIKDYKGENVFTRKIEVGQDTIIGINKYNTLRGENNRIWISDSGQR